MNREKVPFLTSKDEIVRFLGELGWVNLPGLNVQEPWASLIVSGDKTVETRTFACPQQYMNRPIGVVATQRESSPQSALIAILIIGDSFRYRDRLVFREGKHEHRVAKGSLYDWQDERPKWGWRVVILAAVDPEAIPLPRRGIVWTKNIIKDGSDRCTFQLSKS